MSKAFKVNIVAPSFIKVGGTSTQYLMADGSSRVNYTYSSTAPVSPVVGDIWIDSNDGTQYTYVNDGNSNQWIELGSPALVTANYGLATIIQNYQPSSYILQASDNGKYIDIATGGVSITINTSMTAGQNAVIFNNSALSQTITQGAGVTLRQAGTTNTGNRTLVGYGLATVMCIGTNTYIISGSGLA